MGFAYIFQTIGLKHTTPGTNAFLTTVYCVIVPFLSWAVSKKRPDIYNFIAAAICITGIGLVCLDGKMSFSFLGEGFTLICGIFYALQIVAVENGAVISTLFFIRLYSSLPLFYLFYFLYLGRKLPKAYIYWLGVISCICYRICNRALLCIYEYGYKAYNRVKLFAYTLLGIGIRNTFSMIFIMRGRRCKQPSVS